MAGEQVLYEAIGRSYSSTRQEDPRIAAPVVAALGDATTIVNVGAGTGNYEPPDLRVVAVEPSWAMIGQRADHRTPLVVNGVGEALPFADGTFDAALAVLTIHHWSDLARGLAELRRVARRQVVFFFEPLATHGFWALDYFPEALALASEQQAPGEADLRGHLDVREVHRVAVPPDCTDGFGAAYWCRPEAYLDPDVQAGMSWLAQLSEADRARGSERLARDLASGEWERRNGHLRTLADFDGGYRIVMAGA